MAARHTHILFDFFGTLVDYSPSRTTQGFGQSYGLLCQLGASISYQGFLDAWTQTAAEFDRGSEADGREFSMAQLGAAFLDGVLPTEPKPADVEAFVETYLAEWNKGVRYLPGLPQLIHELAGAYRLAVVSNTHHATLVPDHLAAMGIADAFDAVITSVEVGWRKPHPAIYAAALAALGNGARSAIFVGDSYPADFAGPEREGMTAYLIDPDQHAPVPPARRLDSIFDLPDRLRAGAGR